MRTGINLSDVILCLLLTAYCLLSAGTAFAQTTNTIAPVEGHWVLEKATVLKITGSDTLAVDVNMVKDNSLIALYDTLMFKGKVLTIPFRNTYRQGEYNWTDNTIEIPFMAAPHLLDYLIKDERMYFTQQESLTRESCIYLIQTVYKKD